LGSSSFHGTPCLVPAEFALEDGERRRGFITRLSHVAAALSSDPELAVGTQLEVSFKRPSDGQLIEARAGVREHLNEGGLWRGRPASLVAFHSPIVLEEGEDIATVEPMRAAPPPSVPHALSDEEPPARDDEPTTEEQPAVTGFGSVLRGAGLGKRKLAGRMRSTGNLFGDPPSSTNLRSVPGSAAEESPNSGTLEEAFFEDDETAPPAQQSALSEDDATLPPGPEMLNDIFGASAPARSTAEPPPVSQTDPDIGEDEEFIRRFGSVSADFGIDIPGSTQGHLTAPSPQEFLSEPGTLPPEFIAPASVPFAPVPKGPDRLADTGEAPPVRKQRRTDISEQPLRRSKSVPRASAPAARPPWEAELPDRSVASLIPRNARIASTVDVTFWARGRKNAARAADFSREGLFLTYSGTPPVRGAIVRIEFPLEGSDESVPVRFNAEVRWHRSDRPGVGLDDGFGVQILTFETPRDRARYEELLDAILALGPASGPVEGFSWGRPS